MEVQRLYRNGLVEKADQALVMLTENAFRLWLMGEKDRLLIKIYEEQIRIPKKPSIGYRESGHSTLN